MNIDMIFYLTMMIVFVLSLLGFYYLQKTNRNNQLLLKRNISLLREERIIKAVEPGTMKKRRKLLRRIKSEDAENEMKVLSEAKKKNLSAGEILLAQKINSLTN